MLIQQSVISVSDASQVGEARRVMAQLSQMADFDETASGKAAIVATELATNMLKHAHGGEISLSLVKNDVATWLEVAAIDRGPGMSDVGKCLQDGYSTSGTSGTGLGAVRRLSNEFDIYSTPETGTVVLSRIHAGKQLRGNGPFQWGSAGRSILLGTPSGDCWRIAERPGTLAVLVADGLGHGIGAAEASSQVAAVFDREPFTPGVRLLEKAHAESRGSRGAAVAIAHIDAAAGEITYTGIGNISGHLVAIHGEPSSQGLVSHNGIVGVNQNKPVQFNYSCPPQALLIMHSDGLRSRWSLSGYPGLMVRHPTVIAAVLYRDFSRGRDDVAVVVVRISRSNLQGMT